MEVVLFGGRSLSYYVSQTWDMGDASLFLTYAVCVAIQ